MEEIEEVVGDKTTVEADDLDKLTYMNRVIARNSVVKLKCPTVHTGS